MGSNAIAFKQWAANEGLVSSGELEELRGCIVAVDADDYLVNLLASTPTREPLLSALGGVPFSLNNLIASDLQHYKDAGIEPWFIFNGLDLACRDRTSQLKESRKAIRILDQAWSDYDQTQGDMAVGNFGRACSYRTYHIVRHLFFTLHRMGATVYAAPYTAASQMATLLSDDTVDGLVGSVCCLLYGAEKVITSFDFENRRFSWIEMKTCLSKTMLNREQFVDLCLLSGSSICPVFPEVDSDNTVSKVPAVRAAMGRSGNDGYAVTARDEAYTWTFHKARYAIKHAVVTEKDGKIQPKDWESAPNDVHEFISQRMPEELLDYLSHGIIGPRVLNWRTRREVLETPPLDGGHSQTYKDLVATKLLPLRTETLALLTHSLHRYYQNTDVSLVTWFNDNEEKPLNVRDVTRPSEKADSWHVQLDSLATGGKAEIDTLPFSFAVNTLSDRDVAKKTVTPRGPNEQPILHGEKETRANVMWRFLTDRGYIDAGHQITPWGTFLKTALDKAQQSGIATQETEEAIFMAIELLRHDLLNSQSLFENPPYTGAPIRGTEADRANTMLISRIACLANFKHAEIGYTGPLSRHLLAYGQVTATLRGALRDFIEVHACNVLLSGSVFRDMEERDWIDIGAKLPLWSEPNIGLALVVKSYLDELSNEPGRRQDIQKWFNHAKDIKGDLQKTWKLWDAIFAGIQAADDKTIAKDVKANFASANDWLKEKLASADGVNGTT